MSLTTPFKENNEFETQKALFFIGEKPRKNTFTSVKKLLDHILIKGINEGASDIHFEPYITEFRIRFRIDGILHFIMRIDTLLVAPITVRLKVMAQLDIAEKRLPQDGQLIFSHDNNDYIMRISTLSIQNGEKIVLRILKSDTLHSNINNLGLNQRELLQYQRALSLSQGLILVCGPTGSGKTMTLYSGLNYIDRNQKNICCAEDPIEIPLPGINQSQINLQSDLTFARILRAFLRQDPDVIMIGEIRDSETAQIAIQAAHTGHLVLSTLHTNSSSEAILRLNQMGIPTNLLASALKLIISQRLVRLLCPFCKTRVKNTTPFPFEKSAFPITHYEANTCCHCINGYRGRTGIYEFLHVSPNVAEYLFSTNVFSVHDIEHITQQEGMLSLYDSGIELIKKGLTSFSELNRVLGPLDITQ